MASKKNISLLFLLITAGITSCVKDPALKSSGDYLKVSNVVLAVTNKSGARGAIAIASNVAWQLSFENPAPNWMVTNKMAGISNDSLVVTATKDNNTGGYKFANIIATAVNNTSLLPVRITVIQYDSSYIGSRK
ncbi:hypothetical protein CLV51_102206 [Chitinophaga niastensis]|uniref:BACON domain-containing protein n=1 Tax=Chitinophaga niastensis TaxID=536980 RepID=A0A2P8HMD0_CHINA|nr:hypothetical protein [Chitinophaga niastensis]PSL47360.1 hypothetical protein CLV51_102206 [Chitinophaga niastensis]